MAVAEADLEEPVVRVCATPGCRTLGGCGKTGLFCPDCAARLAKVREWFLAFHDRKYKIFGTESPYDEDD